MLMHVRYPTSIAEKATCQMTSRTAPADFISSCSLGSHLERLGLGMGLATELLDIRLRRVTTKKPARPKWTIKYEQPANALRVT